MPRAFLCYRRYIEAFACPDRKQEANTFTEFSLLEEWDDLLLLTGQVNYDHLFVVVSSRKGSISYQTSFERLPSQSASTLPITVC